MQGYSQDLAYVHDAGFTQLARRAASTLLDLLDGGPQGTVLELGCGGGVSAGVLTAAGRAVRGIDLSPAQVEIARARAPRAEFEVGSFIDAELPERSAAILAVGEVFNYAFDSRSSAAELTGFFHRAHAALAPGGVMLFDSAGPGRVPGDGPHRGSLEGDDWAIFHEAREDRAAATLTRAITTFRLSGGHWNRAQETHLLNLHEPGMLHAELIAAGFDVTVRPGYADAPRFPGLDVFIARRGSAR